MKTAVFTHPKWVSNGVVGSPTIISTPTIIDSPAIIGSPVIGSPVIDTIQPLISNPVASV